MFFFYKYMKFRNQARLCLAISILRLTLCLAYTSNVARPPIFSRLRPRPVRPRPRPLLQDQDRFFKDQIINPRPQKDPLQKKTGQVCRFCPVMPVLCR